MKFAKIGFDRSNVGDALIEQFKPRNIYEPIIPSLPKKIELINLFQGLMQNSKLKITIGGELEKQIKEQEWDKTDAGNLIYRHPTNRHDDLFWAMTYACYVASVGLRTTPRPMMRIAEPDHRTLEEKMDDEIKRGLETI